MTKTIEHIEPGARLELREAASALSVDKSTIQRWTKDGLLQCAGIKKSNKRKFWLGAELIRFWKATY